MINLIYFIVILGIIVLVHELGHFLFAKLFKIYVYEFSIGMGPKLFGRKSKNKETEYSIRAIPIGGYVQLAGEEISDDKNIPEDRKLYSKPVWQRLLVMFFGAGFNFIFAVVLLFSIALIWGAPNTKPIVASVIEDYPAEKAGLKEKDYIVEINNKTITNSDDVSLYLQLIDKSKEIEVKVLRNNKVVVLNVKPVKEVVDGQEIYKIGIKIGGEVSHKFTDMINYTVVKTKSLFHQMFVTFGELFTGGLSINQLSGPVGIYSIVGDQREAGIENIVYLIALLSINVGFINLIPLPAFDGGRILFLLIEKIKGSPVKPEVENIIHTVGFFLLMGLMLYITFNDVLKLF